MKSIIIGLSLLYGLFLGFYGSLQAQDRDKTWAAIVMQRDSLFWLAYNNCNIPRMVEFFSDDVEFYHDKGGITTGIPELSASFEKGVCSQSSNRKVRRTAVDSTIYLFPLEKSGMIYGAILTGEHIFYSQEQGKEERATGIAKFSNLWLLEKNNTWKMKRIFSYDHQPYSDSKK